MWTSDLSDCWLNTPDVRTADEDDVLGGPCAVTVAEPVDDLLDHFNVPADPPGLSFHHPDVTFQPTTATDPLSPATAIPLPVLQFYDIEAPLEEQLVTPPVLTKTTLPEFSTSDGCVSAADMGLGRPNSVPLSSTTFSSPLSEPHQEHFILIQLPLKSDDLVSILSRVTNNNEFVVDNNSTREIHHHQQQEPTSEDHISTSTAVEPCSGYRTYISVGETGSDVTRPEEDDVMRMLDDAESLVVSKASTAETFCILSKRRKSLYTDVFDILHCTKLPASLRQPCLNQSSSPSSSSLSITPSLFHSKLKTYLFQKSFPP